MVIACGALGGHIRDLAASRGWELDLRCLPALLHNRPERIAAEAEKLALAGLAAGQRVALGYADCGTYGALDGLCERLGLARLPGLHCYDVLAGPQRMAAEFAAEPGTYVLTDFLVRSFRRAVLAELGLDRYPQLWPDYFGHYRRLVWLRQECDPALAEAAGAIAAQFGLPLTVIDTGLGGLEACLARLVAGASSQSWTETDAITPESVQDPCASRVPGAGRPALWRGCWAGARTRGWCGCWRTRGSRCFRPPGPRMRSRGRWRRA